MYGSLQRHINMCKTQIGLIKACVKNCKRTYQTISSPFKAYVETYEFRRYIHAKHIKTYTNLCTTSTVSWCLACLIPGSPGKDSAGGPTSKNSYCINGYVNWYQPLKAYITVMINPMNNPKNDLITGLCD